MEKTIIRNILVLVMICVCVFCMVPSTVYAQDIEMDESNYVIFDDYNTRLFERINVQVGDEYLDKNFNKYLVDYIDKITHTGHAKYLYRISVPDVEISNEPHNISVTNPTIALYMTHNDESYVTGDGTDSIYGRGGIHDIAANLNNSLRLLGINTILDETLHTPHNTTAYSRSSNTVKKILSQYDTDALFDIHRDGASRSTYVTKVNGVELCKVRIVVGKTSSNFTNAERLALYLLSVGQKMYDWLFLDIYYASGNYNQGMSDKMLLFEMGSHLVEKSLVNKSVMPLAEVINTALFNTTVNSSDGSLTINGNQTQDDILVSDALTTQNNLGGGAIVLVLLVSMGCIAITILSVVIIKKYKKR